MAVLESEAEARHPEKQRYARSPHEAYEDWKGRFPVRQVTYTVCILQGVTGKHPTPLTVGVELATAVRIQHRHHEQAGCGQGLLLLWRAQGAAAHAPGGEVPLREVVPG